MVNQALFDQAVFLFSSPSLTFLCLVRAHTYVAALQVSLLRQAVARATNAGRQSVRCHP